MIIVFNLLGCIESRARPRILCLGSVAKILLFQFKETFRPTPYLFSFCLTLYFDNINEGMPARDLFLPSFDPLLSGLSRLPHLSLST